MSDEAEQSSPPPGGTLHEDFSREEKIVGSSDRAFGITVGAVCGAVGLMRLFMGHSYALWWIAAGAILVLLGLAWPTALAPLNRVWLRFGLVLYKIVNPVVMTVLYGVAVVPTGLLMRLCGKDPLRLRRQPEAASYWIVREPPGPPAETMRNQF
jgi:hypothetical protein